jgi:fibronectin type 3 domain-containing protein
VLYNVYSVPAAGSGNAGATAERPAAPKPLNDRSLAEQLYVHAGAETGKEQCFVVRSIAVVGTGTIESDASAPACVTPTDTFPPAAPKGLAAVGSAGVVNLIWDASTEPDLAGYLILRAESPGATLQPLVREPIRETRYADRTAQPNVRYTYAVIAVDKTGNRSAPSNRVDESAR